MKRKWKETLQFEVFLIPALLSFTVFTVVPLIRTFFYSFTDFDGVTHGYQFVGLANYQNLFEDELIRQSILNTVLYTVCMVVLVNLISLPLSVLLNHAAKSKVFERAVFFFPSVISPLLIGYLWSYILYPMASGPMNSVLALFGAGPVPWLSTELWSKVSILMVALWTTVGWHTVVNIAYLQAIPETYYEAAAIDGAKRFHLFRYITLPMMAPALTVNTLLLLTNGLKVYDLPYALTDGGGPGFSNYTVTQTIIQRGITERQYGLASAMSAVFILIIMVVSLVQFFGMRKREEDLS